MPRNGPRATHLLAGFAAIAATLLAASSIAVVRSPLARDADRLAPFASIGWLLLSLANALVVLPLLAWHPRSERSKNTHRTVAATSCALLGLVGLLYFGALATSHAAFRELWVYVMPLQGAAWAALAVTVSRPQASPATRALLIALGGTLIALYLALMVPMYPTDGFFDVSGPAAVGLVLVALAIGVGAGCLLLYHALVGQRTQLASRLRSLGVAASIGASVGGLVTALALWSEGASAGQFLPALLAIQFGLLVAGLWHQTFPITSPLAHDLGQGLIGFVGVLASVLIVLIAPQDPLSYWFASLGLGWVVAGSALSLRAPRILDSMVPLERPTTSGAGTNL